MKQNLEDIKTLLKSDKRVMALAGFVGAVLVIWLLTGSPSRGSQGARARLTPEVTPSKQGSESQEQYGDLIIAFQNDIEQAKKDREETKSVLTRTQQELTEYKGRINGVFETLVDKFEQLAREVDNLASTVNKIQETPAPLPISPTEESSGLDRFGEDQSTDIAPPPPELPPRVSVIAPGDSVSVRLLTGVNAPVDGTPYPVIFELAGAITGPDGAALDIGSARIVAAAQGSESDGRALFRMTQLAIKHPSGRRSVVEVDGWIVGEDGIRGMSGKLIDKLGRLILTTAWVSGLSALGESLDGRRVGIDRNSSPLSVDSRQFEVATASALTDASNRLGQALLNRYESLVPVVEILPNREVVAIFSKPAEIELLNDGQLQLVSAPQQGSSQVVNSGSIGAPVATPDAGQIPPQ
jgi:Bacterial conjugation TrbI-like protein